LARSATPFEAVEGGWQVTATPRGDSRCGDDFVSTAKGNRASIRSVWNDPRTRIRSVVPSHFDSFFAAAAECGATLLGLLFVAVSIRCSEPGIEIPSEQVALTDTTLFTFANGFILSMTALQPTLNVAYVALAMSAVGLLWGVHVSFHVWRSAAASPSPAARRYRLWLIIPNYGGLVLIAAEIDAGVRLAIHPNDESAVGLLSNVVTAYYAVGLVRAWVLVGGAPYGPRGVLGGLRRRTSRNGNRRPHGSAVT
jgi:hypothetical protein